MRAMVSCSILSLTVDLNVFFVPLLYLPCVDANFVHCSVCHLTYFKFFFFRRNCVCVSAPAECCTAYQYITYHNRNGLLQLIFTLAGTNYERLLLHDLSAYRMLTFSDLKKNGNSHFDGQHQRPHSWKIQNSIIHGICHLSILIHK